jgi:hypothetical protein
VSGLGQEQLNLVSQGGRQWRTVVDIPQVVLKPPPEICDGDVPGEVTRDLMPYLGR